MDVYKALCVVPDMLVKLKQGFGRLIRSESDTGVIAILDSRVNERGAYRSRVLSALPSCRVTSSIEDVGDFIIRNIYCAHCGGRLIQTSSKRVDRNKDGSVRAEYNRIRYVCYNKTRHKDKCDGQTGYTVHKIDEIINQIICNLFSRAKDMPQSKLLSARYDEQIKEIEACLKKSNVTKKQHEKELETLKTELISVIRGESVLDRETLNEMILANKQVIEVTDAEIEKYTAELENSHAVYEEIRKSHNKLLTWAEVYDSRELEVKKMIVSCIISQVRLKRDYHLEVDLNISYQDYMCDVKIRSEDSNIELVASGY